MNCSSHIILIQSCKQSLITEKYSERYPYPPIGLLYISNIGEMNGYDVTILDLYLEPMGRREFLKRLEGLDKPVLVGISSYTDSILDAYKIAAAVKGFYGNIPIIMGGAHVSFMYESVMRECPVVDYCCIGEGEAVLVELLEYLRYGSPVLSSIKSLVYRGPDGEPVANEKRGFVDFLDIAPFPWFSEKMQNCIKNDGGIIFVSSRGCPGECVFCASRALSGSKYRYHSAEWIASLVYFYQRFIPFRMYGPLDDTFTVNRTRLKKFVTQLSH